MQLRKCNGQGIARGHHQNRIWFNLNGILNLSYCFEYRIIINLFREYFWTATLRYIPMYVRLLAYICRFFEFRIEAQLLIQLARHLPILQNLLLSVTLYLRKYLPEKI